MIEQRWSDKEAALVAGNDEGSAIDDQVCALLHTSIDVADDTLLMFGGDDGTHLGSGLHARRHFQSPSATGDLGHQAIAAAFGGVVHRAAPCHGRTSPILHAGVGLYAGLPSPTAFCRYHSLCVDANSLPAELVADAHLVDGTIMGLRHRQHRTFGVQFHPESFRSPLGARLLANFLREAA